MKLIDLLCLFSDSSLVKIVEKSGICRESMLARVARLTLPDSLLTSTVYELSAIPHRNSVVYYIYLF